jgi:DNA-binding transcriptional regulator YhcF (GntR family)
VQIRLDRNLPIPLADQIKGQIIYAVSTGLLLAGTRLPSVRTLSNQLDVAPMTVAHAYHELAEEGIIFTRAGAGTFVADISALDEPHISAVARDNLHQIVDSAVRQALALGYSPDDIRRAFLNDNGAAAATQSASRWVALVGNFREVTDAYAREMEALLGDLGVQVSVFLLRDLRADPSALLRQVDGARLVITVPTRLQEVRAALEPEGCRVVGVAFRVSAAVRRQLSEIQPAQRVGLLATYPEFLPTMMDEVGSFCLAAMPAPYALLGQDSQLVELLAQIDVLVYASGSEEILDRVPERVRSIELRHSLDPDSVRRLRPFLV